MSRRSSHAAAPRHRLRTVRSPRRSAAPLLLLGVLVTAGLASGATSGHEPQFVTSAADAAVPPCPAYLGPQCAGPDHDEWANGQAVAAVIAP